MIVYKRACHKDWLSIQVYAKHRLSQVNVRQYLFATGRKLGLPVTMTYMV